MMAELLFLDQLSLKLIEYMLKPTSWYDESNLYTAFWWVVALNGCKKTTTTSFLNPFWHFFCQPGVI